MASLLRPPGPPKNLLLGDLLPMREDALGFERRIAREYGDVVYLRFFSSPSYQLNHPDLVRQVLVDEAHKFQKAPLYKLLLSRFLGNGLVNSDGDFWRRQRKMLQPAFHSQRIQQYASTMVNLTTRMMDQWTDGGVYNINLEMMRLALSISTKTLFGAEVGDECDRVGAALGDLMKLTDELARSGLMGLPAWLPIPTNRRIKAAVQCLDEIVLKIIDAWRASGEDRGDLLSMLLLSEDENGQRMTDAQVRDEAVTLFLAGYETTANALTWTWILLAQHPDVEAKLHDELARVLGGRLPVMSDMRYLTYTQQIIKESMRLYPPVPTLARQALEDVTVGGYHIPKGATVLICPHNIHRDPRWYDDPDAFKPERFAPENEAALPKYAYFPFGGGSRVCLGNMFAEMEMLLVLATMAQQVRLTLEPGQIIEPEYVMALRPKYHVMMRGDFRQPKLDTVETMMGELAL